MAIYHRGEKWHGAGIITGTRGRLVTQWIPALLLLAKLPTAVLTSPVRHHAGLRKRISDWRYPDLRLR